MVKTVLYGAGNYCSKFFEFAKSKQQEILCIVDGNPEKWGQSQFRCKILSPEELKSIEFEQLIITMYRYDSVLPNIQKRKIPLNKVFIYDAAKNKVIPVLQIYDSYLQQRSFLKRAEEQIKTSLLMEAFQEKEFEGYTRVIVFGTKENYEFVCSFFEMVMPGIEVVERTENISYLQSDKYIFCEADYRNQLERIRDSLYSEQQWLIVPLFDAKNTII